MGNIIEISENGQLIVPDNPIIPFIQGDGIGRDIWPVARKVIDAAVKASYGGTKSIEWEEIIAGEKAFEQSGEHLSKASIEKIRTHRVAIKGPMTTPVGKGFRSLNVRLRQTLDLYACVRPVRYYPPTPSPVTAPEKVDMVVFRENTEDLYAGIEYAAGSEEASRLIDMLTDQFGCKISRSSAIGIKPMSREGTRRLVIRAVNYAIANNRKNVTLMHKGNIMKFTEGGFREWGYETAREVFGDRVITEQEVRETYQGKCPENKIMIQDRIADMVFAEVLLYPDTFDVIACPNLNGDYISDALAAQVGGLGMAPGANIGDECAIFEATHGSAPDIAGKDMANPCSLILSGAMMCDHLGWNKAGDAIRRGVAKTLQSGKLTHDLATHVPGAIKVSCSQFGDILSEMILSAP